MSSKSLVISSVTPANVIDRRLWATTRSVIDGQLGKQSWSVTGVYSIFIMDALTLDIVTIPGLDPAKRTTWALYQFPVAPQQYEISEPASTVITPTQDGGKFIESHGGIFKDIRIVGTVGFRPSPPPSVFQAVNNIAGTQLSMPNFVSQFMTDERGLDPKEATGFDDIIFLRNIFRAYWDSKSKPDTARRWVLVWTYAKEQESYIVEPMTFVTNREAGKPLSWTYNIQLRTLCPLHMTFRVVDDSLGFLGGLSVGLKWAQIVSRAFRDLGKFVNQFSSLVNYVVRLPFRVVDDILGGAIDCMSSLANLQNTMDFSRLPKQTWLKWRDDLRNAYETITGVSSSTLLPSFAIGEHRFTLQQEGKDGDVKKSIRDAARIANAILTSDYLWTQHSQVAVKDYAQAYLDEFGEPPLTEGSPLNPANISIPASARQVKINGGDTIRSIAKRFMGNESYWKMIAIVNSLKPPYIAAVRSPGVLSYDDYILIPQDPDAVEDRSGVASILNPDEASEDQTPVMRRYGRDLLLVNSGSETEGLADLAVNQRGDLALIEGLPNVEQAVMIRLSTEQGELATHPEFGAKYPIGTKFPRLAQIQAFSLDVQRTFRQDSRIKEIEDLRIFVNADQIILNSKLSLRGADTQLPIKLLVRRG